MAICKICGCENKKKPPEWINWECEKCEKEVLTNYGHLREKTKKSPHIEGYIEQEWNRLKEREENGF